MGLSQPLDQTTSRLFEDYLSIILGTVNCYAQGFIRKPAAAPTTQLETVPFTNVLTARIHLWCFEQRHTLLAATVVNYVAVYA